MNITQLVITALFMILTLGTACNAGSYTVAAYYFPGWHADAKNIYRPPGWTGWDQLKNAIPKFTGHQQPKIPLWGYEDETIPSVMEKKITTASTYGVDVFIFDWYYNNKGSYLSGALDKGFMNAKNNDKIKFAIMWSNHAIIGQPAKITDKTYNEMVDILVNNYFKHKSYWKIDNKPYFSIYDIQIFINTFGGINEAAAAIDILRQKTKKAGFDDIYLSVVEMKLKEYSADQVALLLRKLSVSCIDSYVWIHKSKLNNFPTTSYGDVLNSARDNWYKSKSSYPLPFYPNVTMGWDPSPRAKQDRTAQWRQGAYPNTPIIKGNTPENFYLALTEAKKFLDKSGYVNKIITINAWNEWTEGSYLEPDTLYKYKYLEAINSVFH